MAGLASIPVNEEAKRLLVTYITCAPPSRKTYDSDRDRRRTYVQKNDQEEHQTTPKLFLSFYRPKDDKEDLGPHAYTIRNPSYSFHVRVHGDLSG